MFYDFTLKCHVENSVKLQHQDSFHMKKLNFHLKFIDIISLQTWFKQSFDLRYLMSDDSTLKSHHENFIKLQCQDSFHMKKLNFHFEIYRQNFAPNVVQTII